VKEIPVYLPILAEDHRRLIAGIQESEYRSLQGKTAETPEINDRLFRFDVLLLILNTKTVQYPFQFFTIRAVLHSEIIIVLIFHPKTKRTHGYRNQELQTDHPL
jgi:hypothetical protein